MVDEVCDVEGDGVGWETLYILALERASEQ